MIPAARDERRTFLQALTEHVRSPSAPLGGNDGEAIFLPTVPEVNPRTECACQPVADISSFAVTPRQAAPPAFASPAEATEGKKTSPPRSGPITLRIFRTRESVAE